MLGDKRQRYWYLVAAAVLVVAATGIALAVRHHRSMCTALMDLQAENQADTVFKSDSAALRLVRHFDSPACLLGTSNDRMLAHYLLGRAHADMDDAPAAIQDYYDAIECADTMAKDCDFYLLCRVYGQMSNVFYDQGLYQDAIHCDSIAMIYALAGKDTLSAIVFYDNIGRSYEMMDEMDSVIAVSKRANHLQTKYGTPTFAYLSLAGLFHAYIELEQYEEALKAIRLYEKGSGRFLPNGDVIEGYEVFYCSKGMCFLGLHQKDSAEFYFRKGLSSDDIDSRHGAVYGLSALYESLGIADSAAKYMKLSYELNDSIYLKQRPHEVERIQSLYNYQRHKNNADKIRRANRNNIITFAIVSLLLLFAIGIILFQYSANKKKQRKIIEQAYLRIAQAQMDLSHLTEEKEDLNKLVQHKESIIKEQEEVLNKYNVIKQTTLERSDSDLFKSYAYQSIASKLNKSIELTPKEWEQIYILFQKYIPGFFSAVENQQKGVSLSEWRLLMLLRLRCKPGLIAVQLGTTAQNVYNLRVRLYDKLFVGSHGVGRKAEALDNWVQSLY